MRVACWVTGFINTHRKCNNYCFSTATVIVPDLVSVTLHVHCLCCYVQISSDSSTILQHSLRRHSEVHLCNYVIPWRVSVMKIFHWWKKASYGGKLKSYKVWNSLWSVYIVFYSVLWILWAIIRGAFICTAPSIPVKQNYLLHARSTGR